MRFIPKLSSYPNFLPNRGTENAPKNCENEHTSRILDWNFLPCTFIWKIAQTSVRFITAHPESNIFHLENSTFHLENNAFHLENSTFDLENNTFHLENSSVKLYLHSSFSFTSYFCIHPSHLHQLPHKGSHIRKKIFSQ